MSPAIQALYDTADAILTDCTHPDRYQSQVWVSKTQAISVCTDCWNAHVASRRAARRAQLAERPNDCDRCAAKPHAYEYGGYRLCGRCLTATKAEHNRSLAAAGALAIFATRPLIDTQRWAGRQRR